MIAQAISHDFEIYYFLLIQLSTLKQAHVEILDMYHKSFEGKQNSEQQNTVHCFIHNFIILFIINLSFSITKVFLYIFCCFAFKFLNQCFVLKKSYKYDSDAVK